MEDRLQKILSAAGLCSRRTAEVWITLGRVTVNGAPAHLGQKADPVRDTILVDGKPLSPPPAAVCFMLHKPRGYVSTLSDPAGRPTVAELLADCGQRVYPVGRLDLWSEGLLLLTNDGALAHRLLHPSRRTDKRYQLTVSGRLEGCVRRLEALRTLEDGSSIAPAQVSLTGREGDRAILDITIHQGKNRQLRRMCAMTDLRVHRLVRLAEGPLSLGNLPSGKWRRLSAAELAALERT